MFEAGVFTDTPPVIHQFIAGRSIISSAYGAEDFHQTIIYDIDSGRSRDVVLPGGQSDFTITGVEGQIAAGYTSVAAWPHRAFTYDIGTGEVSYIPPLPGGTGAMATAVSGRVVVGTSADDKGHQTRAFAYNLDTGEMTDITASMNGESGTALAVGGGVAAGYVYISGVRHLFAYTLADRRATDCGAWSGGGAQHVLASRDFVVASAWEKKERTIVCRVADGVVTPIETPSGMDVSASALDGRTVVGVFSRDVMTRRAFAFNLDDGKMTVIAPPDEFDRHNIDAPESFASAISGRIVFGRATVSFPTPVTQERAFSYDLDSGKMRDLDTLGNTYSTPYAATGEIVSGVFMTSSLRHGAFGYILP
jgi:uncharacterized membrane protein